MTFDPPADCQAAKERWELASNATMRFVKTMIERTDTPLIASGSAMCTTCTCIGCSCRSSNGKPLGRNKFYEALVEVGLNWTMRNGIRTYSGVRLRPLEDTRFADMRDDGLDDGLEEGLEFFFPGAAPRGNSPGRYHAGPFSPATRSGGPEW